MSKYLTQVLEGAVFGTIMLMIAISPGFLAG